MSFGENQVLTLGSKVTSFQGHLETAKPISQW